ncbi:IclR family transcriptional regulator [Nonomuraea insulae]|uniref:IclR family transcriptional regulator n=1 Tax=Nonomuraea insulae TaxID=1616787 RepID=A0ABW1CR26_9ACTN
MEVQGSQAAYRLLDLLSALAFRTGGANLMSLAQELDLPPSTVRRLLRVLCDRGFAEQDPDTRIYQLGPQARMLGALRLDRRSLLDLAHPMLVRLRDKTKENVFLSVRDGLEVSYLDVLPAVHPVQLTGEPGMKIPMHATSQGKVILAFLPDAVVDRILQKITYTRYTSTTPTTEAAVRAELAIIRKQRFSLSFEERDPGICSISAPVLDPFGNAAAVVCVAGPMFRLDEAMLVNDVAPPLLECTRDISPLLFPKVAVNRRRT